MSGAYVPTIIRNDEGGFNEFVVEDTATISGEVFAANVEPIFRLDAERDLIGYRIYDTAPQPSPARGVEAGALIEQIDSVAKGRMDKLFTRDELGELVRKAWVAWALAQPEQKPHWLLPYAELSDADKLADIVIGQSVVSETVLRLLHRFVPSDGRTYLRAPARADAGTADPINPDTGRGK